MGKRVILNPEVFAYHRIIMSKLEVKALIRQAFYQGIEGCAPRSQRFDLLYYYYGKIIPASITVQNIAREGNLVHSTP